MRWLWHRLGCGQAASHVFSVAGLRRRAFADSEASSSAVPIQNSCTRNRGKRRKSRRIVHATHPPKQPANSSDCAHESHLPKDHECRNVHHWMPAKLTLFQVQTTGGQCELTIPLLAWVGDLGLFCFAGLCEQRAWIRFIPIAWASFGRLPVSGSLGTRPFHSQTQRPLSERLPGTRNLINLLG